MKTFKIAILDDYQNIALKFADWSDLSEHAEITVFNDHIDDQKMLVERLKPFEIINVMRERTPFSRELISQLPNLKLLASTGSRNASIDLKAAEEYGITVKNTGYTSNATIELTWALILANARHIVVENESVRQGRWQTSVGTDLAGKTLGLLGLGNIGSAVAKIGQAFGMKTIAWSENLTPEKAQENGAEFVSKEDLFRRADVVSIHLVLSERTRSIVAAHELSLMKPTAFLVNTSRGPLVVESDLLDALKSKKLAGAAIDVYDKEPLPLEHPLRTTPNVLLTPHIGYGTEQTYEVFYKDTVANILSWLLEQS